MQVGILGTGIVGRSLGRKLVQLGYTVMLGTRDPSKLSEPKGSGPNACTLSDWLAEMGAAASIGTFREAAAYGVLVSNGDHTVFVSGNDSNAKAQVTALLREIGWRDILDLGDISTARAAEMMIAPGLAVIRAAYPATTAFKVRR